MQSPTLLGILVAATLGTLTISGCSGNNVTTPGTSLGNSYTTLPTSSAVRAVSVKYVANSQHLRVFRQATARLKVALSRVDRTATSRITTTTYGEYLRDTSLHSRSYRVDTSLQRVVYVVSTAITRPVMSLTGSNVTSGTKTFVIDASTGDLLAFRIDGPTRSIKPVPPFGKSLLPRGTQ